MVSAPGECQVCSVNREAAKFQLWVSCVEKLTKAVESQPQAAHAALGQQVPTV